MRKSNVRVNRFGNAEKLIGIKPNRNGYPTGYVEISNQLYQLGVTHSNKDGVEFWVRMTKLSKRPKSF